MAKRLTKMKVNEVSLVDVPANQHAEVVIAKSAKGAQDDAAQEAAKDFAGSCKRKRKASGKLPEAMGKALNGLSAAVTAHGQEIAKSEAEPDIAPVIEPHVRELMKAATEFEGAVRAREVRQQLATGIYTLQDILMDVFSSDGDEDDADPFAAALAEIDAFSAWAAGVIQAGSADDAGSETPEPANKAASGGTEAGGTGHDAKEDNMADDKTAPVPADVTKALADKDKQIEELSKRLQAVEDDRAMAVAVSKAHSMLGNLPKEHGPALASILKKLNEDEEKALSAILSAANQRAETEKLFASFGKSATQSESEAEAPVGFNKALKKYGAKVAA